MISPRSELGAPLLLQGLCLLPAPQLQAFPGGTWPDSVPLSKACRTLTILVVLPPLRRTHWALHAAWGLQGLQEVCVGQWRGTSRAGQETFSRLIHPGLQRLLSWSKWSPDCYDLISQGHEPKWHSVAELSPQPSGQLFGGLQELDWPLLKPNIDTWK